MFNDIKNTQKQKMMENASKGLNPSKTVTQIGYLNDLRNTMKEGNSHSQVKLNTEAVKKKGGEKDDDVAEIETSSMPLESFDKAYEKYSKQLINGLLSGKDENF